MAGIIIFIVLIVLVLWILASCIRIVPQAYAIVVERLGAYKETWNTGIHFKTPFIDRVARRVNLKEQVVDFPPQPVITKDNVTMQIDTVVFFQITDPKLFAYGVENPIPFKIPSVAAPHPNKVNGPRNNPSGASTANAMLMISVLFGIIFPSSALKYGTQSSAALLNIGIIRRNPTSGAVSTTPS